MLLLVVFGFFLYLVGQQKREDKRVDDPIPKSPKVDRWTLRFRLLYIILIYVKFDRIKKNVPNPNAKLKITPIVSVLLVLGVLLC